MLLVHVLRVMVVQVHRVLVRVVVQVVPVGRGDGGQRSAGRTRRRGRRLRRRRRRRLAGIVTRILEGTIQRMSVAQRTGRVQRARTVQLQRAGRVQTSIVVGG